MKFNPDLHKTVLFSVWALATVSLVSVIATRELDLVAAIATLGLSPFLFHFELQNRLKKIRWLENSLILFLFFGSVFRFLVLKSSFLTVVAEFLVGFMLLKLAFKKDQGDFAQIIALSFFLLLATSTLALDFTFLFGFIVYILLAAWTLCVRTLSDEQEKELLWQKRETDLEEETQTKKMVLHLFRNCGLTLGIAVLFAGFIFVFFPRLSLAVFQGVFLGPVHKTGFSEKINLAAPSKIIEDPQVAMRVEMRADQAKQRRHTYLRGGALSQFDGKEWLPVSKKERREMGDSFRSKVLKIQRVEKRQFQILQGTRELFSKEFSLRMDENSYLTQKVVLESIGTAALFGVPWIESISVRLPQVTIFQDGTLQRPPYASGRISYEVRSLVEKPADKILLEKSRAWMQEREKRPRENSAEDEWSVNLQIPEQDFAGTRRLTKKIVSKRDPPYLKAKKIERYLRENYSYTLENPARNSEKPLEQFLFEAKKGHCEYFAAAMTLMLRLEGIPARIATGFLMSEWNPNGGYFIVRAKDAHSWVESYMGGIWTDFDPSPRIMEEERRQITFWNRTKLGIDYLNYIWNAHVLSYDVDSQKLLAKRVELKSNELSAKLDRIFGEWKKEFGRAVPILNAPAGTGTEESETKEKENSRQRFVWRTFLLGDAVALFLIFRKRDKLRAYFLRKRGVTGKGGAIFFYPEMLKILSKTGFNKRAGETPYEFEHRFFVGKSPSNSIFAEQYSENLNFLTEAFYKARFSGSPLTQSEILQIQNSLRNLKKIVSI